MSNEKPQSTHTHHAADGSTHPVHFGDTCPECGAENPVNITTFMDIRVRFACLPNPHHRWFGEMRNEQVDEDDPDEMYPRKGIYR